MTRGGRAKQRIEPERRCIVTRTSGPKAGLVRFVVGPEGQILPDLAERLPGRGIWVSADRAALDKAAAKGLFARAARREVRVAPGLADRIDEALARRVLDLIALGRKAGLVIAGRAKVREALTRGEAALLIQAADGSVRERAELRSPPGENALVACLFGHELGLAFGRDRVIHAAMRAGGLTERVRAEARRLAGLRGETPRATTGSDAADGSAGEGSRGKGLELDDGHQG